MSVRRSRLRPLYIPQRKHVDFEPSPHLGGNLSPDLQPNTPPTFSRNAEEPKPEQPISRIGQYLLLEQLDTAGTFKAVHTCSDEQFICKVIPLDKYREVLSAYWCVESHEHVNEVEEILLGETSAYVFFAQNYGDLHSFVRSRRKLKEVLAVRLFEQIVSAVAHCHDNGVVLRDLKLRKFVFKDADRTNLKLEGLEDACVLDDEDNDKLADKHGCPAYVSPEILNSNERYSGKAADIWSLGVMLYTLLIGRYPFHDSEPSALFSKIRRGQYSIPDTISSRAKCLIRSLLRQEPAERLTAEEILQHPWFNAGSRTIAHLRASAKDRDQTVPDVAVCDDDQMLFI